MIFLNKIKRVGDLLYTTALMYHAEVGLTRTIAAKTAKVACATWPSETIFKTDLAVDSVFGLPRSVSAGGLAMDADLMATVSTALDGDQQKKINFMLQSGMMSSALEHSGGKGDAGGKGDGFIFCHKRLFTDQTG